MFLFKCASEGYTDSTNGRGERADEVFDHFPAMVGRSPHPQGRLSSLTGSPRHHGCNTVRLHTDEATSSSAALGSTGRLFQIGSDSNGINRSLLGGPRIVGSVSSRIAHAPRADRDSGEAAPQTPGASLAPLLQPAIEAHGGLKRWGEVRTIVVSASITGAIWAIKGQANYLNNIVMRVDTERQQIVTDFPKLDKRLTYEPSR